MKPEENLIPFQGKLFRLIPSQYIHQNNKNNKITINEERIRQIIENNQWTEKRIIINHLQNQNEKHLIENTFIHCNNTKNRFNISVEMHGAWYCANKLQTAIDEVSYHFGKAALTTSNNKDLTILYTIVKCKTHDFYFNAEKDNTYKEELQENINAYTKTEPSYSQLLGEEIINKNIAGIYYHSIRTKNTNKICLAILQPYAIREIEIGKELMFSWNHKTQEVTVELK